MNDGLNVAIVLVVLLCIAFLVRAKLGDRFQMVSMARGVLLVALCAMESLAERVRPWTLALSAIALALFAIAFVRQARQSSRRTP